MPNLPRLSQAPFISPTNNMLLIPCFMDEVHVVSYLVLSITSNCLQLPASVFKVISVQPLRLDEKGIRSQRRASSSSLSICGPEGAGNQGGEAYLQLTFPNFSFLGHTLFAVRKLCSWAYGCGIHVAVTTLLGKWASFWIGTLGTSSGICWAAQGPLQPRSPTPLVTVWGCITVLLGP